MCMSLHAFANASEGPLVGKLEFLRSGLLWHCNELMHYFSRHYDVCVLINCASVALLTVCIIFFYVGITLVLLDSFLILTMMAS